jgi:hypothetical protein
MENAVVLARRVKRNGRNPMVVVFFATFIHRVMIVFAAYN